MSTPGDGTDLEARAERYRDAVQRELRAVVGGERDALHAWLRYHLGWEDREGRPVAASPGKMLRPVALLLAADLAGGNVEAAVPAAAAVELVHNFSLLHDDVEDGGERRRGRATVWTFAGRAQAINTGDAMYTLARLALHRLVRTEDRLGDAGVPPERALAAARELDDACMRLVRGQYLDIAFEGRVDVTLEEYLEMAAGKTAAMFAAAFAIGALLGGAPAPLVEGYRDFGRHIGLAFQLVDDVLGVWGDPAVTGKPVGDDLLSRKMTVPVILALEADGADAAPLRRAYALDPVAGEDVAPLRALVERSGARARTEAMAEAEERAALEALRAAGADPAAIALCAAFARSAVGRES
ncbi:MAG: polyprenyl synthetase family protein [Dehalococcoidia bacterium]|nr:polyprenyl synthetase family protein [Dehalococcoidia bacterium]